MKTTRTTGHSFQSSLEEDKLRGLVSVGTFKYHSDGLVGEKDQLWTDTN